MSGAGAACRTAQARLAAGAGVMAAVLAAFAVSSCAAPPVTLYALGVSGMGQAAAVAPLPAAATVIEVARVALPDYLDTQDLLLRRGSVLERRPAGRWATRLSLGVTELLTGRLAARVPAALVTDQPQLAAPSWRLAVSLSRLDVAQPEAGASGEGTLAADWVLVPLDPALPVRRDRIGLRLAGPVGTDAEIVALETALLSRLADAIELGPLR
ncbi:MAG: PqiC family protein [Janthinobacterium lividum]